jgi:glycosyltransferase 2 family protein
MRQILLSALKILISAALLYLALRKVNLSELASRINVSSLGWIALAVVVSFLQLFAGALRWCQISAECGAPLTAPQAMRFNTIGTFLIALAIVIVASLPWSYSLIRDPDGRSALLLVDFAALGAGLGFLLLGNLPWPFLKSWWLTHHFYACSVIANRVIFSRKRGPALAVLSILVHVLTVVIGWCVVKSIAAPVTFGQTFQLIPPVMLITMLPISIAGWGLREATMGLAFGYAGLAANEGVNVSLLFGAVSFIVGAIGGLVWIFSAEKAAKGATPIELPSEVEIVEIIE